MSYGKVIVVKDKGHLYYSVLLSLSVAVQLTAALAFILSFMPAQSPLSSMVLPEWQSLLRPEWEIVIYRFFIITAILTMIACIFIFNKIVNARRFVIMELLLTAVLLGAAFKMIVYSTAPMLARNVFVGALVLAVLLKACWPWINGTLDALKSFLLSSDNAVFLGRIGAFVMPIIIFLIIDVPNIPGAVARFFIGEQFHHNDSFIYGPGWAYVSGARLDWDVISQYGVGVGAIFGNLGQMFGGFTYESGLQMMVWGAIIYYILWFFLMRAWLKSTLIAAIAIFLVIKFQLFNAGVYPFAFTYGSATVLRNWFDVFVMIAIWAHIVHPSKRWLILAACASGAQLFYIPSDGVYLFVMLGFYVAYWVLQNGGLKQAWQALVLLLPPLVMFMLMWIFIGPVVWQKTFWINTQEFVAYFLNGFGLTPIYSGLQDRQFLASLMGFVLPTVYVLTLLIVGTLVYLKKINQQNIFACVISVYGLCLYHYYVARSGPSSYYVVALPFVMSLMFWLSKVRHKSIRLGVLALSVGALFLNQNFISYPNRFNVSSNPLIDIQVAQPLSNGLPYFNHLYRGYNEQLKVPVNSLSNQDEALFSESDFPSDDALLRHYQTESDFSIDAALINRLVKAGEPVALISSFEIKMLMDAKRQPYFYYFPLAISHPLHSRTLVRSSIYTKDQLAKTAQKLMADKPSHVFVERVLLTRPLSEAFYYYYSSMLYLTDFVLSNYEPVEEGQYVVALKLKGTP